MADQQTHRCAWTAPFERELPGTTAEDSRMSVIDSKVVNLDDPECVGMMNDFIAESPELWNEDIGE